jgi:hypothetical protein
LSGRTRSPGIRWPGRCRALCVAGYGSGLRRRRGGRGRLAPTAERCTACNQKDGGEQNSGTYRVGDRALPLDRGRTEWGRTEPASGPVSTTPFFRLCPKDHIFKRRGVTAYQIKAKGFTKRCCRGLGCSRILFMVNQSPKLHLILTSKETPAKPPNLKGGARSGFLQGRRGKPFLWRKPAEAPSPEARIASRERRRRSANFPQAVPE